MIIQEKSASVAALQCEIHLLQEKGSLHAKEHVHKAYARSGELEKQVDNLKEEIEIQNTRKDALEALVDVAEKKIQELNLKLKNLQQINNEQTIRICKIERALQVAEEEMAKTRFEAARISNELIVVSETWLPTWLADHLVHCQFYIVTQWNELGRSALDLTIRKAWEIKARLEKWVVPHIHSITIVAKRYAKPLVVNASDFLKPYTVLRVYKFIRSTSKYHRQVQATIHEMLKNHELTKALATNELVWFMTSTIMSLPVILLFRSMSAIFCAKPKKRARKSHTSHTRRMTKQAHLNK